MCPNNHYFYLKKYTYLTFYNNQVFGQVKTVNTSMHVSYFFLLTSVHESAPDFRDIDDIAHWENKKAKQFLSNTKSESIRFRAKKSVKINDDACETYKTNKI